MPSEVDSDTMRKQSAINLKREFDQYQQNKFNQAPSNSEFTSNANVEFETLSNGTNGMKSLGKRHSSTLTVENQQM